MHKLILGNCLEQMKNIPDHSIDLILTDPPYGTTACTWDSVIPLEPMWEQLKRIIKPNGAVLLFSSQPFTTNLISSNMGMFKYEIIWNKTKAGNFIQAKNCPLKLHENITVFSQGVVIHEGQSSRRMAYFPQGVKDVEKEWSRPKVYDSEHGYKRPSHQTNRKILKEGYPSSVVKFGSEHNPPHPTQKPVALMEYLIKTYTNEGETVLDFTMGSGTTGVAALGCSRKFIGVEMDENYFQMAKERILNV